MADLSEEEHDIDIESEDDEKSTGLAFMSEAEKKAHHNALERKRRDQIKESFLRLRDAIPETKNEKSSRAIILKRAIDYIRYKSDKNRRGTREVEEMKRRVEVLKKQLETGDQRVLSEHSDASEDNLDQRSFYYNNNRNHVTNESITSDNNNHSGDDRTELSDSNEDRAMRERSAPRFGVNEGRSKKRRKHL